jgi:hypothetical protein
LTVSCLSKAAIHDRSSHFPRRTFTPLELRNEKDLAALGDRLEIGSLVDRAVDRDGGFFFQVQAQAGVEAVHFLDDAAQVPGLDREFAHAPV